MESTSKLLSTIALGVATTLPVHAWTPATKPVQTGHAA
jgi:hypothetical protein